jgi:phage FluMu protein Com
MAEPTDEPFDGGVWLDQVNCTRCNKVVAFASDEHGAMYCFDCAPLYVAQIEDSHRKHMKYLKRHGVR